MKHSLLTAALLLCGMAATAKVTLPSVYTSNMVVQQQSTLKIHGKAAPGADVSLQTGWSRTPIATQADKRGKWYMEVATPKAGGPYTLLFSDGEETLIDNVLVGEVWLGSGQSNMEMPLAGWGKVFDYEKEIAAANFPKIRLLQVKREIDLKERDCFSLAINNGGWQECSPQTVPNFSALCYFFGLRLWQELEVPVGLIDDSWGGTPTQSWIQAQALGRVVGYQEQVEMLKKYDAAAVKKATQRQAEEMAQAYNTRDIGLSAARPWSGDVDHTRWATTQVPGLWPKALDGVVWYKKEISIPKAQAGQDLTLSLGEVDDEEITYFNGEQVGVTTGYNVHRRYTVPGRLVKEGKNIITVRVLDTASEGGFRSAAKELFAQVGDHKMSLAGEWYSAMGLDQSKIAMPAASVPTINQYSPMVLYNAMIAPLVDFPVRGILWYQGCANVGNPVQHESLFQTLIQDWRRQWHQPDMPFIFAQLANYLAPQDVQPHSMWAWLRETQAQALTLHNTGMACNIDLGDAKDIHPKSKRELGRRMAAIALNQTYGQYKTAFTAPTYSGYSVEGSQVAIHFAQPQGSEPFVQGRNLPGFTIAGPDHKWHVATARTEGDKVIVSSNKVPTPVAVRYGWADNPTCTMRTASGLPVAPFRTDSWSILP